MAAAAGADPVRRPWSQSPAGFVYDPRGMDINYNFEVMLPEMAELYLHTRNPLLVSMTRKFSDWFGYNLLREPDGSGWLTYYAVSDRTATAYYDDAIPDPDQEHPRLALRPRRTRARRVLHLPRGQGCALRRLGSRPGAGPRAGQADTSPRVRLAHTRRTARPCRPPRRETCCDRADPVLRRDHFTELAATRWRTRNTSTYGVRASTSARSWRDPAGQCGRAGARLPWHPVAGTVIHAQQTSTGCWATVRNVKADAESNLVAEYPSEDLVRYRTTDGSVSTDLILGPNSVTRRVTATTATTEQVPLVLRPGDEVTFSDGTVVPYNQTRTATAEALTIKRGPAVITITWSGNRPVSLTTSTRTYLRDQSRRIHVLRIPHDGVLETTVRAG